MAAVLGNMWGRSGDADSDVHAGRSGEQSAMHWRWPPSSRSGMSTAPVLSGAQVPLPRVRPIGMGLPARRGGRGRLSTTPASPLPSSAVGRHPHVGSLCCYSGKIGGWPGRACQPIWSCVSLITHVFFVYVVALIFVAFPCVREHLCALCAYLTFPVCGWSSCKGWVWYVVLLRL